MGNADQIAVSWIPPPCSPTTSRQSSDFDAVALEILALVEGNY